jgi:hypothetical protein
MQNWLNIWKKVIVSSIKQATDCSIQGVSTLQRYFCQTKAPQKRTPAEQLLATNDHPLGTDLSAPSLTSFPQPPIPYINHQTPANSSIPRASQWRLRRHL